ncbi:hypothetical protein APR12_006757 [Nocardia amikacinitolerans]|uniref:hypothetical protein n=1 Tax=Nocardia amikacinitolerans TaxID=756689 RepID=UPI000833E488|nr:hypothetical protein [Nocardia amikacinitolerans]MCP2321366.1 hypothetical protein [Nocardia amikacinitolerans]
MIVTLITADSAQPDPTTAKVHALGIGWSWIGTPTPPMSIIAILDLNAADLEPAEITLVFDLVDAEDKPVSIEPGGEPLRVEAVITPGHEANRMAIPFTLGPGLPLEPGSYSWRVSDDGGKEFARVGFGVRPRPVAAG